MEGMRAFSPFSFLFVLPVILAGSSLRADEKFLPGFPDGKLTGWVNVNCAPDTWRLDEAGVLHCTGKPTGALRTERQYGDFIMEVEWRHLQPGGNAGIFVWSSAVAAKGVPFLQSIEVQVLDNSYDAKGRNEWYTTHGDIFPIHGSTMEPYGRHNGMRAFPAAEHSRSSPEWNHYRIEGRDGALKLYVNGHLTTQGSKCVWRRGYLGLESEGSPTEWKNLRIAEPGGPVAGEKETAPLEQGWTSLYTGTGFTGWKAPEGWEASDWQISGQGAGPLVTERELDGGACMVDVQAGKDSKGPALRWRGVALADAATLKPGVWHRLVISRGSKGLEVSVDGGTPVEAGEPESGSGALSLLPGFRFANIYHRAPRL